MPDQRDDITKNITATSTADAAGSLLMPSEREGLWLCAVRERERAGLPSDEAEEQAAAQALYAWANAGVSRALLVREAIRAGSGLLPLRDGTVIVARYLVERAIAAAHARTGDGISVLTVLDTPPVHDPHPGGARPSDRDSRAARGAAD